jgi:alkanesulfonate monooxygenase SsuD/methylene tetrahydromethanopterin reductase-like flavin-dependent oxidoreductase (luciferase family)
MALRGPCDHASVTMTPPARSTAAARRPIRFGISVTPLADAYPDLVAQVLAAERGGLDVVGIQDHPYQRRFLDTFVLIADLLARTSRLRFFPDVANLQLRPPTMLAKAAVSLDVMSGGRFELGLGAGGFGDAVVGMGGPRRSPGEAADALEEAIPIIRAALDVGPDKRVVRGSGPVYPVPGYPAGPPPAHRVEIWIGAYRPRGLRLIGRVADGWVPSYGSMGPVAFRAATAVIDDAATAAGRDPLSIRRIYNIPGVITDGPRGDPLVGPVDQWVETLTSWALGLGVDTFVYWPPDSGAAAVERFAAEVAPAVREAIEAARPAPQRD